MNRKSIFMFNLVFILALSFFYTKIVYGYEVHIKEVLSEHVRYDPNFYGLSESTYILAGITMSDIVKPLNYIVEVKWDTNTKELPFQFYSFAFDRAVYKTKLGYVPPTSFDDWDNKSYTFYVNDTPIHTDTIADGALRKLATPKAFYNRMTKTISWNSVAYADGYVVRILNSTDVDDMLFDSRNLGLVNQYTFDAAYHSLLDSGAILSVEAWDYIPGNMNNTSIYVTNSLIFTDVDPQHWAYDYIMAIYEAGITTGCSKNPPKYCPSDNVTREQMAAFIVRAVEGEPPANYCASGSSFSDVPTNHWACKYIKRLSELEITTGCGGGKYCPSDNVTRAQMAAFLARAFLEME